MIASVELEITTMCRIRRDRRIGTVRFCSELMDSKEKPYLRTNKYFLRLLPLSPFLLKLSLTANPHITAYFAVYMSVMQLVVIDI